MQMSNREWIQSSQRTATEQPESTRKYQEASQKVPESSQRVTRECQEVAREHQGADQKVARK